MVALQRVAQSSISTTGSNYASCMGCLASSTPALTPIVVVDEKVASDQFPVGLKVLVVDDDTTCLRIVEQMLRRCHYYG